VGTVVKGFAGGWRVALDSDAAPIDFVQILLFTDFAQIANEQALAPKELPSAMTEEPSPSIVGPTGGALAKPAAAKPADAKASPAAHRDAVKADAKKAEAKKPDAGKADAIETPKSAAAPAPKKPKVGAAPKAKPRANPPSARAQPPDIPL
jgi:hypothetical protein